MEEELVQKIWEISSKILDQDRTRIELKVFHTLFTSSKESYPEIREYIEKLEECGTTTKVRKALKKRLEIVDPAFLVEQFEKVSLIEIRRREKAEELSLQKAALESKAKEQRAHSISRKLTSALGKL